MVPKSERSFFIFEILKQTTYLFDGKFHLKSQLPISGSLGNGPVDFAIEFNGAIVMVTEAKKQNIDQGVAQCAIQLDSVGKRSSTRSGATRRTACVRE